MGVDINNPDSITPQWEAKEKGLRVTDKDAIRVYTELFEYIAPKWIEAQITGKPLLLVKGEDHINRGSYAINEMVADIAQRLGITHVGVECAGQGEIITTLDGRRVPNPSLEGLLEFFNTNATNGVLPETHDDSLPPGKVLHNGCQFFPRLLQNEALTTFTIDTSTIKTEVTEEVYRKRENFMLNAIEENAADKDVMVSCGAAHVNALTPRNRTICAIDGNQAIDIKLLREKNPNTDRNTINGFHPRFNTGWVPDFGTALKLAQTASREVGNVLEDKFKELLADAKQKAAGTLTSPPHLGARMPEQQERRRG